MAKKQAFGDKVGKQRGTGKNHVKVIRTGRTATSGTLRFYEEMVHIPEGKNADSVVKELLAKES